MTTRNDNYRNEPARTDPADAGRHDHEPDTNPDPITGSHGSHPAGTGIGSISGAATGAALGALGGPIGALIGGISGAIVGGGIGHGIGEAVDPTEEESYWRDNYHSRPYVEKGREYEDYGPAYRTGVAAGGSVPPDTDYDHAEPHVRSAYDEHRHENHMDYDKARPAIRDAYDRVQEKRRTNQQRPGEDAGSR
ncbi:MAG: hypothetical protein ACFCVE_09480 [Phycisphaerae bacterium]